MKSQPEPVFFNGTHHNLRPFERLIAGLSVSVFCFSAPILTWFIKKWLVLRKSRDLKQKIFILTLQHYFKCRTNEKLLFIVPDYSAFFLHG
jgi:hypothetical protein